MKNRTALVRWFYCGVRGQRSAGPSSAPLGSASSVESSQQNPLSQYQYYHKFIGKKLYANQRFFFLLLFFVGFLPKMVYHRAHLYRSVFVYMYLQTNIHKYVFCERFLSPTSSHHSSASNLFINKVTIQLKKKSTVNRCTSWFHVLLRPDLYRKVDLFCTGAR